MKLHRLCIKQAYRSLAPFDWQFHPDPEGATQLNPICLVGVNGSGKSQLLELLADIFCYIEQVLPPYKTTPKPIKGRELPEFELEYWIKEYYRDPEDEPKVVHVRIVKEGRKPLIFRVFDSEETDIDFPVDDEDRAGLLPKQIVGYTSGENETLSFPFFTVQEKYAERVRNRAIDQSKYPDPVPSPRPLFADYDSNAAIVIANYLFQEPDRLKPFNDLLRLHSLRSFRIKIQFHEEGNRKQIRRTPELDETVAKLRRCSTLQFEVEKNEAWILDFFVNDATKEAFRHEFGSPRALFLLLHQLRQMNALGLSKRDRQYFYRQAGDLEVLTRPPTVMPKDMVFRIASIRWNVDGIPEGLDYTDISDGEHQFLLIAGLLLLLNDENTLFLLDEPETHFNPAWRAKFFTNLNALLPKHDPQILLTTHSPFIVSDCRGHNVYWFRRDPTDATGGTEGKPAIRFNRAHFETYGSSFDYILKELFGMDEMVAEYALADLHRQVAKVDVQEGEQAKLRELRRLEQEFGESFDKAIIYEKIAELTEANG